MKYFFHIGYKGNAYRGWQRQPGVPNVQEVVETALSQILKTTVTIMGCGRTDALVHASQFFFHLEVERSWDFDLQFRLNKLLPDDIAVFEIIPVQDHQHARYDAIQRTYDYFLHTYKDPFLSERSALYMERDFDLEKMRLASSIFLRHNDFQALCKTPADYKHTRCRILSTSLYVHPSGERIRFQITANRFLGRMVRMMMGALLEVGRREMSVEELDEYLIMKQTPPELKPAYPQGLYLSKVTYPYLDLPTRAEFSFQNHTQKWEEV